MTAKTTATSNGDQLKNLIGRIGDDAKARAILTIENFIEACENDSNSLEWELHVFCRRGKGDDYDYQGGVEFELAKWFIEGLMKTFMNPEASKIYTDTTGNDAFFLQDYLPRLQHLFESLEENMVARARMDLMDITKFGSDSTETEIYNKSLIYEREYELMKSREETINKYMPMFK
jgi:hypothetical protein